MAQRIQQGSVSQGRLVKQLSQPQAFQAGLTFSFGYFLDLVFRAIFSKFGQNTGFVKYTKEKVEKQKMLKMLIFMICEAPQKISTIFKSFLAIFTLFHLKNWPYLQKPEFGSLAKTRF